jgi:hypothetical protein
MPFLRPPLAGHDQEWLEPQGGLDSGRHAAMNQLTQVPNLPKSFSGPRASKFLIAIFAVNTNYMPHLFLRWS